MLHTQITCPNCHIMVLIPFTRALEAKAADEYDMAEISAQDKLDALKEWLREVSLLALLKYWFWRYKNVNW